MIKLRYGNTNTFFIPGSEGGLLVDTDWAGTKMTETGNIFLTYYGKNERFARSRELFTVYMLRISL